MGSGTPILVGGDAGPTWRALRFTIIGLRGATSVEGMARGPVGIYDR